ncbi:MAG: RNA polymerase sigma factor [Acidobacteriota bacterium]
MIPSPGDRGALSRDFERRALPHVAGLRALAANLCSRSEDAEELVQETLFLALRAFGSLRVDSNVRAWLFQVARNAHRSACRRRLRRAEQAWPWPEREGGTTEPVDPRTGSRPEELARGCDLRRALAGLPSQQRELVISSLLLDVPRVELARTLHWPEATVRTRLLRARRLLRRQLDERPAA